jgi:hypothetical protein
LQLTQGVGRQAREHGVHDLVDLFGVSFEAERLGFRESQAESLQRLRYAQSAALVRPVLCVEDNHELQGREGCERLLA